MPIFYASLHNEKAFLVKEEKARFQKVIDLRSQIVKANEYDITMDANGKILETLPDIGAYCPTWKLMADEMLWILLALKQYSHSLDQHCKSRRFPQQQEKQEHHCPHFHHCCQCLPCSFVLGLCS